MATDRVLAIIPAYNEEECIQNTVEELMRVAPDVDYVVINDGSKDRTSTICHEHGFNVIDHPINLGLTGGFQTGMKYAFRHGYDYAVQFDADGQHRPEYLETMRACARDEHADIVIGSRFVTKEKEASARMMGSRLITSIIKLTTGATIKDPTSGLRMFNRKMIEQFATRDDLNPEPETIALLIRKGACVREVQADMRERQGGESYLNLPKSIAYMIRACTSILFVQWFR